MSRNLRDLLNRAFAAGAQAGLAYRPADRARIIDDLVRRGEGLPVAWVPEFDAMAPAQEEIAFDFCEEVQQGRGLDPVTLLEVAERLYRAERDFVMEGKADGGAE